MHTTSNNILTSKVLVKEYLIDKNTFAEIAKKYKCHPATVSRAVKKFGLKQSLKDIYLNKKFGYLTVIEITNERYQRCRYLKCKCDCGNIINVVSSSIATGNTKSCGCKSLYLRSGNRHKCWKGYGDIPFSYWQIIIKGAKERNLKFDITIEYIWDLFVKQNNKCALSGLEIFFSTSRKDGKVQTASLDRIDSTKGYIEENVQWVHKDINMMKQSLSQVDFINFCKLVVNHNV